MVTGLTHHGIRALCTHSPGHSSPYINSISPLSPGLSEDILEAGVILAPSASERRCRLSCKRPRWRLEGWSKPWEGTQALPLTQRTHQRTLCMCWEERLSSLNPTSHQECLDAGTDVRAGRDPENTQCKPSVMQRHRPQTGSGEQCNLLGFVECLHSSR